MNTSKKLPKNYDQLTVQKIQKWANALRSGKYEQGRAALQSPHGYCCLGLACKVSIPSKMLQYSQCPQTGPTQYLTGGYPANQAACPVWLKGIDREFENLTGRTLSGLNDSGVPETFTKPEVAPLLFDEIADLLEAVFVLKVLDGEV